MRVLPTAKQREYLNSLGVNEPPPRAHFRIPAVVASAVPQPPSPTASPPGPTGRSPAPHSPTPHSPAPVNRPVIDWSFNRVVGLITAAGVAAILGYLFRAAIVLIRSFGVFAVVVAMLGQPQPAVAAQSTISDADVINSATQFQNTAALAETIGPWWSIPDDFSIVRVSVLVSLAFLATYVILAFIAVLAIYQVRQLRSLRDTFEGFTKPAAKSRRRGERDPGLVPSGNPFTPTTATSKFALNGLVTSTATVTRQSPRTSAKRVAAKSVQGPVRPDNQDACATLSLPRHDVIVLADGMGGVPHGALASQTAVAAAVELIERQLTLAAHPRTCLEQAFAAATKQLREQTYQLDSEYDSIPDKSKKRFGLRTTLLIVIATDDAFTFGYIGDGSIHVRRGDQLLSLLTPDRPNALMTNVVTCSLGPEIAGKPTFNTLPRSPSDVLIAATDGIADRVDAAAFTRQLLAAIQSGSQLDQVIATSLHACSILTENNGTAVFDDNMSLAIINCLNLSAETPTNQTELAACSK